MGMGMADHAYISVNFFVSKFCLISDKPVVIVNKKQIVSNGNDKVIR